MQLSTPVYMVDQQAVVMLYIVVCTRIHKHSLLVKGVQPADKPWHTWWP
jgi:hypothetical protein